jgi:hypothetical protein
VTTPKIPRPEPTRPGSPATGRGDVAPAGSATRIVAIAALVLALVALGLTAWRLVVPADPGADCQERAWNVDPAADQLPAGWSVSGSQYDLSRKQMSFVGPVPADEVSSQAVIYATITCFEQGAEDAVNRSRQAAEDAGQSVIERDDLGDQSFSAVDDTGAAFLQLRHGPVVVYLAASGDASATTVDELASAFDRALGGDGGTITPPSIAPSSEPSGGSLDPGEVVPGESPAAPALVAALPVQVGDIKLATDSASGSTILADDQGSRAILAALREAGREPDDLKVAQAYDETGESDLSILGVTVDGLPVDKTRQLVLDSWLAATGAGVTTGTVTLGGRTWTRIDYGDGGTIDYLLAEDPNVIVVTTADPAIAEAAAAALP